MNKKDFLSADAQMLCKFAAGVQRIYVGMPLRHFYCVPFVGNYILDNFKMCASIRASSVMLRESTTEDIYGHIIPINER